MIDISDKAKALCSIQQKIDELYVQSHQLSLDMEYRQELFLKEMTQMSNSQKNIAKLIDELKEFMSKVCEVK